MDPDALLAAEARIWTSAPGSSGTNSFSESAVVPGLIQGGLDVVVLGARQNSDFRTNFGLINLSTGASTAFQVTVEGAQNDIVFNDFSFDVLPLSLSFVAVPQFTPFPLPTDNGYIVIGFHPVVFPPPPLVWYGFATSADNTTGDAWYSAGIQYPPPSLTPSSRKTSTAEENRR
jgi:hypothetical protein